MNNKILITAWVVLFSTFINAQSVGINTPTPDASAVLDVKSTTKGLLIPRMTTIQRNAVAVPATGLQVFDTDTKSLWVYDGSAWGQLSAVSSVKGLNSLINNAWDLTGNELTDTALNFIGTTDVRPLRFRVNNLWAGEIHPTSGNLFWGVGAGQVNTTGYSNTAVGGVALNANSTGFDNTAIGAAALYTNTTGKENTALGRQALFYNTTGYDNTATGYKALRSNTAGIYNTANGTYALHSNTTGNANTSYGYQALYSNTITGGNTATGSKALFSNTGWYNTANAVSALYSNTTGNSNTANGYQALYLNTTGNNNNASGYNALYSNTTGSNNNAYGLGALSYNTTGSNNIAVGINSGNAFGNLSNCIGIGNDGNFLNGASNQVIIGNSSTLFIGGKVNWGVVSDERIKRNIKEDVKGLDFIMKLRPVTYNISNTAISELRKIKDTAGFTGKYDGEKITYTGFLAQEVEQAAIATGYNFSGYTKPATPDQLYTIRYAEFVVPLVKAMQEQQVIIEELKREIEILKKKK
jgi:trimeric autotransporter adhesin